MRINLNIRTLLPLIVSTFLSVDTFCSPFTDQFEPANALYGMIVGPGVVSANEAILRPFSTDGCSLSPNSLFGVNFVNCCIDHDIAYWLGGSEQDKITADQQFKICVREKFQKKHSTIVSDSIAEIYYYGVSLGGVNSLPNSFRWGYGWNYMRPYKNLTTEEIQQAETLYGKNLKGLKVKILDSDINYSTQWYTLDNSLFTFLIGDKIIYTYLQKFLKRNDVIVRGSKTLKNLKTVSYKIQLKSCGKHDVEFMLDVDALKGEYLKKIEIELSNYNQWKSVISGISDPSGCLEK
ncbi:MAG: hypothetical protein KDD45_01820 [Bdellovibrionales bacterium]|nr:hypothetical protein [Bdellovibrionales bacterium]